MRVMETNKRVLGKEHPNTLNSMANLAWTWKYQKRNDEALNLIKKCIQIREKSLGLDHPDTKSLLETLIK